MTAAHNTKDNYSAEGAERLVITGFRCWMAGFETGDVDCWELVWREYANALGPDPAKTAVAELACWVRSVRAGTSQCIRCHPYGCRYLSGDECMALALVSGWQHANGCVIRAAAINLMGATDIEPAVESAGSFAKSLLDYGQQLTPVPLAVVADIAGRYRGGLGCVGQSTNCRIAGNLEQTTGESQ